MTLLGGEWSYWIAKVNRWDFSPEGESAANALLIAAAPDLYTALKGMLQHFVEQPKMTRREQDEAVRLARQAIDKALGKVPRT